MITVYLTLRNRAQWALVKPYAHIIIMKRKTIFALYVLGFAFVIVRRDIEAVILHYRTNQNAQGFTNENNTSHNQRRDNK